jgi:hypothetical protein
LSADPHFERARRPAVLGPAPYSGRSSPPGGRGPTAVAWRRPVPQSVGGWSARDPQRRRRMAGDRDYFSASTTPEIVAIGPVRALAVSGVGAASHHTRRGAGRPAPAARGSSHACVGREPRAAQGRDSGAGARCCSTRRTRPGSCAGAARRAPLLAHPSAVLPRRHSEQGQEALHPAGDGAPVHREAPLRQPRRHYGVDAIRTLRCTVSVPFVSALRRRSQTPGAEAVARPPGPGAGGIVAPRKGSRDGTSGARPSASGLGHPLRPRSGA